MSEVLVQKNEKGLGSILLNRPESLNALDISMIRKIKQTLDGWMKDDEVKVILFSSTNERAFCAGGDIKALYEAKLAGEDMEEASSFFVEEYELDGMIYTYPKPIIANLDGIVMGGGVGLTYGAPYKIVTERTKWAMPEMNISLYPDVGASYFLNKAPGHIGRYVALTAKTFEASDVLYMNAANYYMNSDRLKKFLKSLEKTDWTAEADEEIKVLIEKFSEPLQEVSFLERHASQINEHFQYETVEQIVDSLQKDESDFAKETAQLLTSLSPVSLKVTLQLLIWAQGKTIEQCLGQDISIAKRFMKVEDFFEGVRSVLIDKDRNPSYKYKSLEEVSDNFVQSFFNKEI